MVQSDRAVRHAPWRPWSPNDLEECWTFVREGRTDVYLQHMLDTSTNTTGYRFADLEAKAREGVPALMNSRTSPKVVGYEQVTDSVP